MTIALTNTPNQAFSISIGVHFYDFTIQETSGCMSVTIVRDNLLIVSGSRAVAASPVIPYQYLEDDAGNFVFLTQNEELPYYDQFGITQSLVYVSNDELEVLRGGN